jgi:Pyruvate phosphate dikinase, AMP/ATP-binding domain
MSQPAQTTAPCRMVSTSKRVEFLHFPRFSVIVPAIFGSLCIIVSFLDCRIATMICRRSSTMMWLVWLSTMSAVTGWAFPLRSTATASIPRTEAAIKATMTSLVVPFGGSAPALSQELLDKQILGGKGVGLQEMSTIGIAVPPGFTLTTAVCRQFQETGDLPEDVWQTIVDSAIPAVERDMGRRFGHAENPLLFSCRSGAAISMPGMMDTVLNIVRVVSVRLLCPLYPSHSVLCSLYIGTNVGNGTGIGSGHGQCSICLRRLSSTPRHVWQCRHGYSARSL